MPQTPPGTNISDVHIVIQRHAQATSNIGDPAIPGIRGDDLTMAALKKLAEDVASPGPTETKIQCGDYLADGLTEHGLATAELFVTQLKERERLANVYVLASSDLSRSVQTAQLSAPRYDLVGTQHTPVEERGRSSKFPFNIHVHPGLREVTPWPQDLPGEEVGLTGRRSYIKLRGGSAITAGGDGEPARTPGDILGEVEVDISTVVWPPGVHDDWETVDERIAALRVVPSLSAIEARVRAARVWLRSTALDALWQHHSAGGTGTPRIVVVLHGGLINFLTQDWCCSYSKGPTSTEFLTSSSLRNFESVVYNFASLTDEDARLVEVDRSPYYEQTLGSWYRHLHSEGSLDVRHPDGTLVDQKAGHWKFVQDTFEDVSAFAAEREDVLRALVEWTGAENFLKKLGSGAYSATPASAS